MQWRAIKGYEGYYEVSDSGEVRSVDREVFDKKLGRKFLKGKIMKQAESKNPKRNEEGYYVVNLRKESKSKVSAVHRLVAEAFIPNNENLPTVNHKDGNKHNNKSSNLEWASYSKNNTHALSMNLRRPRGNEIAQINLNGDIVAIFDSACEAARETGISRGMISHCLNHRANTAGGFIWRKIEKCNDYPDTGSTAEDELPSEAQERAMPEDIVWTNRNV